MRAFNPPNEVLMQLVSHFVPPPLPYVGMETSSFAEDAKEWRGDVDVKGRWKDRDTLRLVSSRFRRDVEPIFVPFLVLESAQRASDLVTHLNSLSHEERDNFLGAIKVVCVSNLDNDQAQRDAPHGEHPFLVLLGSLPNLVHVHIRSDPLRPTSVRLIHALESRIIRSKPLEGLTGLILDSANFKAAIVALRQLAPSLRQLWIYTGEANPPSAVSDRTHLISFPELISLGLDSYTADPTDDPVADAAKLKPWLESKLSSSWHLPMLNKIALPVNAVPVRWSPRNNRVQPQHEAVHVRTLEDVGRTFSYLEGVGVKELSVGVVPEVEVSLPSLAEFKTDLDEAAKGQVGTIEVVVVVCQKYEDWHKTSLQDQCLAELVSRKRMPALKKVVWVLASGPSEEHRDVAPNSGALAHWKYALSQAGVEFESQ